MDDIHRLYYNAFGIAFQWKRGAINDVKKIQLVFKKTCLSLTVNELSLFSRQVEIALRSHSGCKGCTKDKTCHVIILQTPALQLSFAVNLEEIKYIEDLVNGVLFQIELKGLFINLDINT